MAVKLSPIGNDAPFIDASGNPLSGGLLYTYTAGSSAPENTYTTSAGSVANANPIVLDSNGYPATGGSVVSIWLTSGVSYKFTLKTSAGVTVWTRDNISGINDTTVSQDQWQSGATPTYISATSFSLVGDQTTTYQPGRRLKSTNSGGTIYSTIVSAVFGAVTTIVVVNDSGTLDSGLSAVSYGLLSATNPSTPLLTDAYPVVSGSSDKTKKLAFEIDGFTTATTRTATWPDKSGTVAMTSDIPATRTRQVFTSGTAATYTTPANCRAINVRMVGGGGGGGGASANNGATGVATTWSGSSLSAAAGVGGVANAGAGGAGGAATNGDINIPGGGGGGGNGTPAGQVPAGGVGGNSAFGGGALSTPAAAGSNAATNSGGGGSGGGGNSANTGAGGGAGGYVEKLIASPAATYTYTVGTGGAGGAAGTLAGGNGAAGIIIVDEFY